MSPLHHAVVAEALSWVGTPYQHCQAVKGAGVDCAMLLVRVYGALGLVPADLDPRPYAPDWHCHRSEELFLGWLQRHATCVAVLDVAQPALLRGPLEPAQPGDVQVWRYGRTFSHGAICLGDGRLVHAVMREGAVVLGTELDAELLARPMMRYRLHALQAPAATTALEAA